MGIDAVSEAAGHVPVNLVDGVEGMNSKAAGDMGLGGAAAVQQEGRAAIQGDVEKLSLGTSQNSANSASYTQADQDLAALEACIGGGLGATLQQGTRACMWSAG